MNKIICEDLMKITQIIVLMNKYKNSERDRHYYFCILGDVALNYHPTKFGSNYKRECEYMDKTVKNC